MKSLPLWEPQMDRSLHPQPSPLWPESSMGSLENELSQQVAQLVRNLPAIWRPQFDSWVGKIPWRRDRPPTPVLLGFPGGSADKESACSAGDLGSIPGLGRSPGEGNGYPLQYSDLENYLDCGPWGRRVGHDWTTFTFNIRHLCNPLPQKSQ